MGHTKRKEAREKIDPFLDAMIEEDKSFSDDEKKLAKDFKDGVLDVGFGFLQTMEHISEGIVDIGDALGDGSHLDKLVQSVRDGLRDVQA